MSENQSLKVCFYLSAFPVLSETFILNQIAGLIDAGHQVHIIAERYEDTTLTHPDVHRLKLKDKVTISGDSYSNMPKAKLARILAAIRLFKSSSPGLRRSLIKSLNFIRFGKETFTLNLIFRLAHFDSLNFDPDVILCHFAQNGEKIARLKAVGALSTPLATVYHGHDLSSSLVSVAKNPYRYLFSHGDLHLPVSKHWSHLLVKLGCPSSAIAVHHMGVDTSIFSPATHTRITTCKLLSVARIVEKKGLNFAVDAVAKALEKVDDIEYRIVGDGPLRAELELKVQSMGLSSKITFHDPVDSKGIIKYMHQSDIFMLPSVTAASGDKEGIPVVLMEAMSCSLPVVSTFHSGIPELVEDGVSGMLANEKDVEKTAQQLVELARDRVKLKAMGHAARERIERDFSVHSLNATLAERLEKLLVA